MPRDEDHLLDADTLTATPAETAADAERPVPTLTVLAHPHASRVGETFALPAAGLTEISRATPSFRGTDGAAQPLLTPFLSRSAVTLLMHRTGARIDASGTSTVVTADGEPVAGALEVDTARLDRGVVLELGTHVALLLHRRRTRPTTGDARRHGLIGDSDALHAVRAAIDALARRDRSVLIRGETGTGKELVAAALHRASARASRPYVVANMAAIPPTLAASELFGHARGAFSGAQDAHDGFFVRADGGTLFLDEVGDTPDDVQAALLRVLESGEVQAVGSKHVRRVNVRVVAATDADVDRAIASGRFRAPVFYRLAQAEIVVPPLRDRKGDVARLLVHFLRAELAHDGQQERLEPPLTEREVWLPASLVARLVRATWPGNVRQLRSVAAHLATRDRLRHDDPALAALWPAAAADEAAPAPGTRPRHLTDDDVARALHEADYRLSVAADRLGVSRPAFNALVDRHPTLRRAAQLDAAEISAALQRAEATGEEVWRLLEVSKQSLNRRRGELGV